MHIIITNLCNVCSSRTFLRSSNRLHNRIQDACSVPVSYYSSLVLGLTTNRLEPLAFSIRVCSTRFESSRFEPPAVNWSNRFVVGPIWLNVITLFLILFRFHLQYGRRRRLGRITCLIANTSHNTGSNVVDTYLTYPNLN